MRIGFCITHGLDYRGTGVAVYQYAHFNELLLKNTSIIFTKGFTQHRDIIAETYTKFEKRFRVIYFGNLTELPNLCVENNIDMLYIITDGSNAISNLSFPCKIVIHCVFHMLQPHGDVYAAISDYVAETSLIPRSVVPHIVHLECQNDEVSLRAELGIPEEVTVFGRLGGLDTFNIDFVREVVEEISRTQPNIYFLFASTPKFIVDRKNVIFLPAFDSEIYKKKFILTCDALLHARWEGETFGLVCGEFGVMNKPVITYKLSKENNHLRALGSKGLLYQDRTELHRILTTFDRNNTNNWKSYAEYTPEKVMAKFKSVFID